MDLVLHWLLGALAFPGLFMSCGENGVNQHPYSLHPTPRAAHPAHAQHPAPWGCWCKPSLPANGLLGSGSFQKSAVTSSGHQSQRLLKSRHLPAKQQGIALRKPSTPANTSKSTETQEGHPPHPSHGAEPRGLGTRGLTERGAATRVVLVQVVLQRVPAAPDPHHDVLSQDLHGMP